MISSAGDRIVPAGFVNGEVVRFARRVGVIERFAAVAKDVYSNNSGAVRNCRFVASEGSGLVGLDLGHRNMNGPLLVRNCEVIGFQRGICTARAVNGQTFEHITLSGQAQFGFDNEGQSISIRGLRSETRSHDWHRFTGFAPRSNVAVLTSLVQFVCD